MNPSLRYLTVEGVYPSRKDKNLSIQIGVGRLGGRGHRFGWSSIRGGTEIAVGSLVISITFETSVLKGTTRTGYTFIEFIAKSLRNMKTWHRTRLAWHRGLIYGPLFALIRLRPKPKLPVNMSPEIRTDI